MISPRWLRIFSPILAFAVCLPLLAACGAAGTSNTTLRVGTKDFTEEYIVGEMYRLLLEDAGFKVDLKRNLPTPAAQTAMEAKELDLYPEYTGTGLVTVLKLPPSSDPKAVFDAVSKGYKDKYNFVWLVKTLSDMVTKADQLTMIGPAECPEREDCIKGLKTAYGNFQLKNYIPADAGLRYPGLINGQADVVVAFSTDGQIAQYSLVVLKDDKNFFPVYQLAPVVRQEVLDKNPKIKDALNKLAPKLTDETMQRLNNEVDGNKKEPADVAKQFLQDQGLIKK